MFLLHRVMQASLSCGARLESISMIAVRKKHRKLANGKNSSAKCQKMQRDLQKTKEGAHLREHLFSIRVKAFHGRS